MWIILESSMPGLYNVYDDDGNPVVVDCTADRAMLIASVTEMLEALTELYHLVSEVADPSALDNGVYAPDGTCEGNVLACQIIEQARVAIAKAGGSVREDVTPSIAQRSHEYADLEDPAWR